MNNNYDQSFCSSPFKSSRDTFNWDIVISKIAIYIDQQSNFINRKRDHQDNNRRRRSDRPVNSLRGQNLREDKKSSRRSKVRQSRFSRRRVEGQLRRTMNIRSIDVRPFQNDQFRTNYVDRNGSRRRETNQPTGRSRRRVYPGPDENILHKNKSSNLKSKLTKQVNAMS